MSRRAPSRRIALVAVTLAIWLAHFDLPTAAAGPELDPSWHQALGRALVLGLQAGVDVVFPYGPLGYFFDSPYEPGLYLVKVLGWELVLELVLAGFLAAAAFRARAPLERALCVAALLAVPAGTDAHAFLALLAIALWRLERVDRPLALRFAVTAVVALLALVKFTYFAVALGTAALVVVDHARRRGVREGLRELAVGLGALATVWVAIGQSPANMPRWIAASAATARGHNEAMALQGPALEVALLAVIGVLAALVLAHQALARPRSLERALPAAAVLLVLAAAAKAGFVRHTGTSQTFFAVAAAALFWLPRPTDSTARGLDRAARGAAFAVAVWGFALALRIPPDRPLELVRYLHQHYRARLEELAGIATHRARIEAESRAVAARHDLPLVRARVGRDPVDVFTDGTAIAFLNGLAWRPRPVFQSYAAYTPDLCERNARFLAGAEAPRWVLFRHRVIDMRLPDLADGPALRVLLERYAPVLVEGGHLLLERRPEPGSPSPDGEVLLERTVALGEPIDLAGIDGRALLLEADVEYSVLGRIVATLLKSPVLYARTETAAGPAAYRVTPRMLASGVLVRPFLDNQQRWLEAFSGEPGVGLDRITILARPDSEWSFEPRVRVRIRRRDAALPAPEPGRLAALTTSMFLTEPREIVARQALVREVLHEDEILIVHAPAEVRFDLAPGAHRIVARYGIKPEAVLDRCTDGVAFAIVSRTRDGREELVWQRYLDPTDVPLDRGYQELDHAFTSAEGTCELVLRTSVGPARDESCDWAFWSKVELR